MSDNDQSERPTEIEDPESYVNHRRLKSIFDIRESLHGQRTEIVASRHGETMSEYESLSVYRALVSSYIVETEPILGRFDGGNELLTEFDFGETVITPRFSNGSTKSHRHQKLTLDVSGDPDMRNTVETSWSKGVQEEKRKVYSHNGLLSLLDHPDPLIGQWDIPVKNQDVGKGGYQSYTHTVKQQVDFRILDTMVRSINKYLAEIGFELEPEKEDDPAHLSL